MANIGPSLGDLPDDEVDIGSLLSEKRIHKRWVQEITFYETKAEKFIERGKKILRRYKDDRSPREQRVPRFNILWSNIQTLKPALYSQKPKPDIERRFRDKDKLGRYSSMVLERGVTYFVNEQFDQTMDQCVLDRLLPGRGTIWVRYEPHFKDASVEGTEEVRDEGVEITDDAESYGGAEEGEEKAEGAEYGSDESSVGNTEEVEEVADEVVCWDYVHWQDYGHTFGRVFEEVDAVWRKVYLTREELEERFGEEIGKEISLDYTPHDLKDNKYDEVQKKATIYEIWCKSDKKVYWIHKDYQSGPLDVVDDPLRLSDFYPCPRPLYATLANDDLFPVADYIEYQDQAHELDELTSRIGAITRAVKVAGVYDASAAGVERILAEGVENQLVPVNQWAVLAEKGGLQGVMTLLPMKEILETLLGLYEARDKVKQDLYEITGIADIIRGTSDPNETAAAQKIKGKFGTMRLQDMQEDVQRFARDLIKIGAQIIAEHFQIETIKKICGVNLLTAQEKQMLTAIQRGGAPQPQLNAPGSQPQAMPAPLPLPPKFAQMDQEELEELMENPTWEEIEQLLRNEVSLSYRIDIETDSTIKFDQDNERDARVQFLDATGKFLQSAMQSENAELAPLLAKLLMFGVRGFKVGKELESAFEVAIHKLEKQAANPQQKPDPEMMKVQGQMQIEQMKAQTETHRLEMQAAVDKNQAQLDAELEKVKVEMNGQLEMAKARMDNETKIIVAQIAAKASIKTSAMSAKANEDKEMPSDLRPVDIGDGNAGPTIDQLMQTTVQQLQQAFAGVQQSHQQLAQAIAKPKQVSVGSRDENGNIKNVMVH